MKDKLQTIICATDLSDCGNQALPVAIALAEKYEAKLIVTHIIEHPAVTPYVEPIRSSENLKEKVEENACEIMQGFLDEKKYINWELIINIGTPASEIVDLAKEKNADLVVAATHNRTGIERLLLGSVSRKLMHTLPCLFLIVPSNLDIKSTDFKKILIACDFSPDSIKAVKWGSSFALRFESELHLVTVMEPKDLKNISKSPYGLPKNITDNIRQDLSTRLKTLLPDETDYWCYPKISVLLGAPHEELNKYALMNDIDLIVIGVHGGGFINSLLVGSTTDRLTRLSQCAIMVVRDTGEKK